MFVGDELLVSQCAEIARDHGLRPVAVVSRLDVALQHARDLGIPAVVADADSDLIELLAPFRFDVLFSIAYQRIVPPAVLEIADTAINFHDGLLPGYGGLNVTTWSIDRGEREHGVTWHLMDELADRGDVLIERRFDIRDDDTALSLNARCYEAGLTTFGDVAAMVASGTIEAQPQPAGERRMFRRTERPVVVVEPDESAARLERSIRAIDTGPRMRQAMGGAHCLVGDRHVMVGDVTMSPSDAGTVVGSARVVDTGLRLAFGDADLVFQRVTDAVGDPVDVAQLLIESDETFGGLAPSRRASLAEHDADLSANEAWWATRLRAVASPGHVPLITPDESVPDWSTTPVPLDRRLDTATLATAVVTWLQVVEGGEASSIAVSDGAIRRRVAAVPFTRLPVVTFPRLDQVGADAAGGRIGDALDEALRHGPWLEDLIGRDPDLRGEDRRTSLALHLDVADDEIWKRPADGADIDVLVRSDGRVAVRHRLAPETADRVAAQLAAAAEAISAAPSIALGDVEVVSTADRSLFDDWNDTVVDHDRERTIDAMFRAQATRTPDAAAVSCGGVTLTYAELATEVAAMTATLVDAGVARGDVVGVAVDRGVDMVVTVLAILGAGAHYLPLDPAYPADRIAFMVTDSGAQLVVGDPGSEAIRAAAAGVAVLDPAARHDAFGRNDPPPAAHGADDLAYVIYTSGSTGTPKGVLLEHREVVNFFTAMDRVVGTDDERQVWLAVTSLSFDISVLELLWPLTNGGHVVVKRDSGFAVSAGSNASSRPQPRRNAARSTAATDMSLFYFAADAAQADDGYRLLMEGARWADTHDFAAIWTPERHFHHFGAPYPNPSVIAAALAAVTDNVAIRAGSVVAPLHSPIRIAEEWSVVDNLSRGRVGISFAAGWQPNDFVLNPEAYADARNSLPGLVDTVQRLWRGESVDLPGHDGAPVSVSTLPRPVQAELPVWMTSAGNPASFARAGALGHNVLTHLIGQTLDQLEANIEAYRSARREAGHDGDGHVTLMLHSYLHHDADHAREVARQPLKGYLGTAVGLLKDLASAFPTFGGSGVDADEAFRSLTPDELSQLLDHAADRYLSTAGLFGSVDDGVRMAQSVVDVGVDEIACLIDFGIDDDAVLEGLSLLGELRDRLHADDHPDDQVGEASAAVQQPVPETVGELIAHHGVTHLQCTPSLASMLVANPDDRAALGSLRHMMVGGEALAPALGSQLLDLVPGRVTNMYGPTETTIWSLVHDVDRAAVDGPSVPIGRPIANTTMYVLDPGGRAVPVGVFGELHLGGEGVARGYHDRPELTAERFVERPGMGRTYATGDVVRIRPDGVVEFGGRSDNQVKIRGHRIELSEIESVIDEHDAVVQSVVTATAGTEPSLIAHVVASSGSPSSLPTIIRDHVRSRLPDAMVPSFVVVLDAFPLTPNGKIDRNRLPAPEVVARRAGGVGDDAASDSEALIADVWATQLGRVVGRNDNFFDVGGHSLLAVSVFRELSAKFGDGLALTDIFRFPTVATLGAHVDTLTAGGGATAGAEATGTALEPVMQGTRRGEMRRRARGRRPVADG